MPKTKDKVPVTVLLTRSEKSELMKAAKRSGASMSTYVAARLTNKRETFIARIDRDELLAVRFQFHKIGVNLNQLAAAMNSLVARDHKFSAAHLTWLEQVADELSTRLAKLDQDLYELRPMHGG
jgi:hypothetical protein